MIFKKKFFKKILATIFLITATSCNSKSENKLVKEQKDNSSKVIVFEAENLELKSAKIINEKGARGKKAIKMLSEEAMASKKIKLPRGKYIMNVILKSTNEMSDGFYLIADNKVKRTSNFHFNKWVYGLKFLIFESDGKKPIDIIIASSYEAYENKEFGMLIDAIEISEFCNSADVLERWTK